MFIWTVLPRSITTKTKNPNNYTLEKLLPLTWLHPLSLTAHGLCFSRHFTKISVSKTEEKSSSTNILPLLKQNPLAAKPTEETVALLGYGKLLRAPFYLAIQIAKPEWLCLMKQI